MKIVSPISPIPTGFSPEGVAQAAFDSDLLYLIDHAIPSSIGGLKVFTHLLYYATLDPKTTMQHSLFQATGAYGNEAIILIKSIETLARAEGSPCAPETYHKVLLAFEAMQVIRRIFHRNYTEIRITLGKRTIHIPTLLAGLKRMYKKYGNEKGTNKFQTFALRVATRLKSGEFSRYESSPSKMQPEHQAVAQVLVGLLEEHNVKEVHIPSLNEACELIALALQKGRVGTKSGESVTQHSLRGTSEPSESVTQADEFVEDTFEDQLSDQEQLSEFVSNNSPDFPIACAKKSQKKGKTRLRQKKGESETLFATNSPDRGHLSTHLGESAAAVSFIDHLSLENITNNGSITMNDAAPSPTHSPSTYKDPRPIDDIRHDAADLAERLDGSRKSRWLAKLITCVQRFPPHVRRLAEIDTLYHSAFPDYRGKPKVPGAWFAKRCEEYVNPEWKTKNEIRQWNESGMDLMAIHQELQRGRHTPMVMMLPFDAELEDAAQGQRDNLDDGPAGDVVPFPQGTGDTWKQRQEVLHHSLLHTRMDLHQAEALCKHIRQEGLAFGIQADVYPGDHEGEFVVVTSWDGNEEEWTNASEWNRYFEKVKKCYQKNGVR